MLPITKSPPKHQLADLTVLLYGPSKIGKSTWCAQADGALINNEFYRVLTKLAFLPYRLFLVSHVQEKEIETRTGKSTCAASRPCPTRRARWWSAWST